MVYHDHYQCIFQWFDLTYPPPIDVETEKSGHWASFWALSEATGPGFAVFVLPAASTCQSWSQVTDPWTTKVRKKTPWKTPLGNRH